jgi:hypothetical protein
MAANPFTRGICPGRARPIHEGGFKRGQAKRGGRKKKAPNAIPARVRKAIETAVKRVVRGTNLPRKNWLWEIDNNPLIREAREHQGRFTLAGAPRLRSRAFNMKAFCRELSAVAMRAIKTGHFADQDLVECLTLLAIRDPSEFAKFLAITAPRRSYLAARPDAEMVDPPEAINPGEYRHPPIPEWTLRFDPTLRAYTPLPVDPALTPQDACHPVFGSPLNPAPGSDWKFDAEERRYRPIALRPKTPIPEWTLRFDAKNVLGTPVPVSPRMSPEKAYHSEYGRPIYPAPGFKWEYNSRIERLVPRIADEPSNGPSRWMPKLRYRWHPDERCFSVVREDDDLGEEDHLHLYEYDVKRSLFKRYHPPLPPLAPSKPRIGESEPEAPPRRRFFVRHPDGSYSVTRSDEPLPDEVFECKNNRFVRVPEYGQTEGSK